MTPYIEFLKSKIEIAPETGFDVKASEIHPILKPHQRDAVIWALKGGRRALFEAFGLGKTIQQLEYLRLVAKYEPGKVLIVCPLQFDIVERIINRFSNKGDLVFDPFGGISTVPYMAVKMGRNGYGSELNPDYWKDGCGYLKNAELEADMPTLFDLMEAA